MVFYIVLTDWYEPEQEPFSEGVYELNMTEDEVFAPRYAYWDGQFWRLAQTTIDGAEHYGKQFGTHMNWAYPWRGLTFIAHP